MQIPRSNRNRKRSLNSKFMWEPAYLLPAHMKEDTPLQTGMTPTKGSYENIPFSLNRNHGVFVSWSLLSAFSIHSPNRRKTTKEGKLVMMWGQRAYQQKGSYADRMARTIHRGNHDGQSTAKHMQVGLRDTVSSEGRRRTCLSSCCVSHIIWFKPIIYKYIHLYSVCLNVCVNLYLDAWVNAMQNSAPCKHASTPFLINHTVMLKDGCLICLKRPVFSTAPSGGIPPSPFPILVCRLIPCQVFYHPDTRGSACNAQGHPLPFPEKWPKINTPSDFYKHSTPFMAVPQHSMGHIISLGSRLL